MTVFGYVAPVYGARKSSANLQVSERSNISDASRADNLQASTRTNTSTARRANIQTSKR
jgi:hypothetical protein